MHIYVTNMLGAIQVLRKAMGVEGVSFPGKKLYEGVRFNVISVTRGMVIYVLVSWSYM